MALPRFKPPAFLTRYWFPLCLIALLLLAVPGVVLFVLNLTAHDGAVNRWLEQGYQLSYHLPIPWWGALILLLLPLAVLLLYFLKLKRKPLAVPSTFLWRKSIEDLHVNSLLQWLRENVLLLLQILALLALIYGIMAFRFHGAGGQGKPYILMIDNSASMSATDVGPSRLEWAKQEALKEIDAHTDRDAGMVIVFNSVAEIRQSYTNNRHLLRDAVRKVGPTQRPTRIEEALSLADSMANPVQSTENVASKPEGQEPGKERTYEQPRSTPTDVHLFSDGRFPDLSEAALANLNSRLLGNQSALGGLTFYYHVAGVPGPENVDNVGLVTFNALRDDRDPANIQAFVRAVNFRPQAVSARVRVEVFEDGQLQKVYERTLALPARKARPKGEAEEGPAPLEFADASTTFDLPGIDGRKRVMLHAKLLDLKDKFPLDDEAWLVVNVPRPTRVLIVGGYNEALDKFFNSDEVREVARVDQLAPEALAKDDYKKPARNGTYDLVVFDRCAPASEEDMPRSNTFFIGAPPPPWKKAQLKTVANPTIVGWQGDNPILKELRSLYTVGIAEAFQIDVPENAPNRPVNLIEGRDKLGLLLAWRREAFTDLVMTFALVGDDGKWNTDFWLQTSFPVFLTNVLYHLGNLNDKPTEDPVQPGGTRVLRPGGAVRQLDVIAPDGQTNRLAHGDRETRTDFAFGATERVGVYKVKWDDQVRAEFAVNLLDVEESNIEPRTAFEIGPDRIEGNDRRGQPRELWKYFALAALAVLLTEWYVYNRRVYV